MIKFVRTMLSCPIAVFGWIAAISIFALAAALFSEVALGLEPCILCIYQRIPFVIGAVLAIAGLAVRKKPAIVDSILGVLAVNFMTNTGIAAYHTGVEQKWWASEVEGCNADFGSLGAENAAPSTQSILENILSAPSGNCAEIPWQDPILGLSMANYNVALCFGIFAACLLSILIRNTHGSSCVVKDMKCD